MPEIKLTLPDGETLDVAKGSTVQQAAAAIGAGLGKACLAGLVDGQPVDSFYKLERDAKLEIVTQKHPYANELLWHSSAHILAEAVLELFPEVKLTLGPPLEEGFFYDMQRTQPFTEADLKKIEARMEEILKRNEHVEKIMLPRKEALAFYKDNPFKREIMEKEAGGGDAFSFYRQGKFMDLCRGPHLASTGKVGAVHLTKVAGAYWRGDAKNPQLQRIYGIAFWDKKEKDAWLKRREEAEKRNHMRLGKELDLWSMQAEAPGCVFFHGSGMALYNELLAFMRHELFHLGYEEVNTPIVLRNTLWKESGHWDHYQENMYFVDIDGEDFGLKPMNCPPSTLIYRAKRHSYRDLPRKMAEFGLVHRHELSGVLNGLFRVRKFVQDDAHIYCAEEQLQEQVRELLDLADRVYKQFGFEYRIELSTKPGKAMGDPALWVKAEAALEAALKASGRAYKLNPGDGAFYGPKIDYHLQDALGRTWQCGTIQLDFQMPERFNLIYISKDDKVARPIMIHRAILGSVERFLGILTEHYAGAFPFWLSPVQAVVLSVGKAQRAYAEKIHRQIRAAGIRCNLNAGDDTLGKKIRDAEISKAFYSVVVGEKEEKAGKINVRDNRFNQQSLQALDAFLQHCLDLKQNRKG